MSQVPLKRRTIGDLLSLTIELTIRHFVPLFVIAVIVGVPSLGVSLWSITVLEDQEVEEVAPWERELDDGKADLDFLLQPEPELSPEELRELALVFVLFMVVTSVAGVLQTGASLPIVAGSFLGEDHSVGESLRIALKRFVPLLLYTFTLSLILFGGFVLLIIPFFIFLMWFYVGAPVVVIEGVGVGEALARSRALTKGRRWEIFVFTVAFGMLTIMVSGIVGFALGITGLANSIPGAIVEWLLTSAVAVAQFVGPVVWYFELRVEKESFDVATLGSLVDQIAGRHESGDVQRDVPGDDLGPALRE